MSKCCSAQRLYVRDWAARMNGSSSLGSNGSSVVIGDDLVVCDGRSGVLEVSKKGRCRDELVTASFCGSGVIDGDGD